METTTLLPLPRFAFIYGINKNNVLHSWIPKIYEGIFNRDGTHHFISTLETGGDHAVKIYFKCNINTALKASGEKRTQQVKKCFKPC